MYSGAATSVVRSVGRSHMLKPTMPGTSGKSKHSSPQSWYGHSLPKTSELYSRRKVRMDTLYITYVWQSVCIDVWLCDNIHLEDIEHVQE